jgi:hypothetical protein
MTDSPCVIEWTADEDGNLSVAEFVRQQAQQAPPLLAWAEPDPLGVDLTNHTGRRDGFALLVSGGMPSWPADLPLAEARLFWTSSALHVVAREGGGCGWAWIEEKPAGNAGTPVARSVIPVHTLRDGKRFGLPDGQTIAGLRAIEYRQQGRLVAWRLTTEEA